MVTIVQGPRTYMKTLLKYINGRITELRFASMSDNYEPNSAEQALNELIILKRRIESGNFEEKPDKTITPPKVVL